MNYTQHQVGKEALEITDSLSTFVNLMRPKNVSDAASVKEKVDAFIYHLQKDKTSTLDFFTQLLTIIERNNQLDLYTQSGILSNEGFFSESYNKISNTLFPPLKKEYNLRTFVNTVFSKKNDFVWIDHITLEQWQLLFQFFERENETVKTLLDSIKKELGDAVLFLSYKIAAIGIEPILIEQIEELENSESPFLIQNKRVSILISQFSGANTINEKLYLDILSSLEDCKKFIGLLHEKRNENGTSLSLSYTIVRLSQIIERTELLLKILFSNTSLESELALVKFLKSVIRYENKKHSLREHISQTTWMIAYQITEHAVQTGEHYITSSRREYYKMFYSALKGGFIVAFLSCFKTLIYYLKLSPFGTAFLYSMNYSFGFIGILLTGGTLATKQPAMTATKIAASLDINTDKEVDIPILTELIAKISRSQLISFVGNVAIAFPIAYLIGTLYFAFTDNHVADVAKAKTLIAELHPFKSLSLFHAGIAGVCLFLSGIISGYYDNMVVYKHIPQRVLDHPLLAKILPLTWRKKLAHYLEHNMGGIAGNFFLGVFLGSIGTIGFLIGLPIDIRHITFAAGNFGLAVVGLEHNLSLMQIAMTSIGIVGIGIMNFVVSFGLALYVALRARNVHFYQTRELLIAIGKKFVKSPLDFIRPPKSN